MLPRLQLRVLVQGLPGREPAERNRGGREVVHAIRLGGQVGGGCGDVLGGGAGAVETDQTIDLVAWLQSAASGPVAATTPDRSWQGMAGQLSGQSSSPDVMAVARTSTSTSPDPASGTGMSGCSGWPDQGSRRTWRASCGQGRSWAVSLSGRSGARAGIAPSAAPPPTAARSAGSAEDLLRRADAMLPAPGQIPRAPGFRVHGLDDLAVPAEILDAAGDLDVYHTWLVADRSPTVHGSSGLVHVVTGPDSLARAEISRVPARLIACTSPVWRCIVTVLPGSSRISSDQPSEVKRSGRNHFPARPGSTACRRSREAAWVRMSPGA